MKYYRKKIMEAPNINIVIRKIGIRAIAKSAGISASYLSDIINDKRSPIPGETFDKIKRAVLNS